jgi:hypothetical protein
VQTNVLIKEERILKNKNKLCSYKKLSVICNICLKTFGSHLVRMSNFQYTTQQRYRFTPFFLIRNLKRNLLSHSTCFVCSNNTMDTPSSFSSYLIRIISCLRVSSVASERALTSANSKTRCVTPLCPWRQNLQT